MTKVLYRNLFFPLFCISLYQAWFSSKCESPKRLACTTHDIVFKQDSRGYQNNCEI